MGLVARVITASITDNGDEVTMTGARWCGEEGGGGGALGAYGSWEERRNKKFPYR